MRTCLQKCERKAEVYGELPNGFLRDDWRDWWGAEKTGTKGWTLQVPYAMAQNAFSSETDFLACEFHAGTDEIVSRETFLPRM